MPHDRWVVAGIGVVPNPEPTKPVKRLFPFWPFTLLSTARDTTSAFKLALVLFAALTRVEPDLSSIKTWADIVAARERYGITLAAINELGVSAECTDFLCKMLLYKRGHELSLAQAADHPLVRPLIDDSTATLAKEAVQVRGCQKRLRKKLGRVAKYNIRAKAMLSVVREEGGEAGVIVIAAAAAPTSTPAAAAAVIETAAASPAAAAAAVPAQMPAAAAAAAAVAETAAPPAAAAAVSKTAAATGTAASPAAAAVSADPGSPCSAPLAPQSSSSCQILAAVDLNPQPQAAGVTSDEQVTAVADYQRSEVLGGFCMPEVEGREAAILSDFAPQAAEGYLGVRDSVSGASRQKPKGLRLANVTAAIAEAWRATRLEQVAEDVEDAFFDILFSLADMIVPKEWMDEWAGNAMGPLVASDNSAGESDKVVTGVTGEVTGVSQS